MNLTIYGGTAQQRQWVNDALAACTYDFAHLNVNLRVTFTGLTACKLKHTYMCTSQQSTSQFEIQIEPWADDPTNPNNTGLPDPYKDLHEFFMESFIHELGHVVSFSRITTQALEQQISQCFKHRIDQRRGTWQDWEGLESTLSQWADRITEATAEWFRLAYLPKTQIFWNRTNWELSPADFATAFAMIAGGLNFTFGPPVDCGTGFEMIEAGASSTSSYEPPLGGAPIPLGYASKTYQAAMQAAYPGYAWDFTVYVDAPVSGADQVIQPGPWGLGEEIFTDIRSGGESPPLPGFPLFRPGSFVPDVNQIYDPTQPWATTTPPSVGMKPLGGDMDARSGWLGSRGFRISWDLPPGHSWGYIELTVNGQWAAVDSGGLPIETFITAEYEVGYDTQGNPMTKPFAPGGYIGSPPDVDPAAPFSNHPVTGVGPAYLSSHPFHRETGYISGRVIYNQVNFFSVGIVGGASDYVGVADLLYTPPAYPGPAIPPSSGTSGGAPALPADAPDGYVGAIGQFFQWEFSPIEPLDIYLAWVCDPQLDTGTITYIYTGPLPPIDFWNEMSITARFFPVLSSGGAPPPYPTLTPGSANGGLQQGGSLRSNRQPGLSGRALQIVDRVGGGGVSTQK